MNINDCDCRHFTGSPWGDGQGNVDLYLGVKQLNPADQAGAAECAIVEFRNISSRAGDEPIWDETYHNGFFTTCVTGEIFLPDAIVERLQEREKQLLDTGFTFQGEVVVNAETRQVTSDGDEAAEGAVPAGPNWLMQCPTGLSDSATGLRSLLSEFLWGVFAKAKKAFGFTSERHFSPESKISEGVLMRTESGFELKLDRGVSENIIHSTNLEGAGVLSLDHGHRPLLVMLYVQSAFEKVFTNALKPLVTFCDENGESFAFERVDSLTPIVERYGFNLDEVLADAELLGLVEARIDLSTIETEQSDCYF